MFTFIVQTLYHCATTLYPVYSWAGRVNLGTWCKYVLWRHSIPNFPTSHWILKALRVEFQNLETKLYACATTGLICLWHMCKCKIRIRSVGQQSKCRNCLPFLLVHCVHLWNVALEAQWSLSGSANARAASDWHDITEPCGEPWNTEIYIF